MYKHLLFYTALFSLLLASWSASAQRSTTNFDYRSGLWTLGITGGASWQGSDVCAIPGWGVGIDLAKNIYHRPHGLLDLDLRGRALYTRSFGADHFRSYGIANNPAVNGSFGNADYTAPNGPGFTFMNHRTDIGELSLEGVLTANRLRENTGIILQGFGGIGLNGYSVSTHQLDRGELRNLAEIDTSGRRLDVLSQLGAYNYHETLADDYENAPRISFMPSLGIGVGYQVTPSFSVGVEHKTTWAMHDNLDGQRFNQYDNGLSDDNDRYNYTSLYLRWKLRGRYNDEAVPTTQAPVEENYAAGLAPIITFSKPRKEVSTVSDPRVSFSANIENIAGRQNIEAIFNDKPIGSYTYNDRKDKFSTILNLVSGTNELVITATNKYGKDVESRVVFLEESIANAPTPPRSTNNNTNNNNANTGMKKYPKIRITRPSSDPHRSDESVVRLTADIEHVSSKNNITFKINGKTTNDYEFGYLDNTLVADIPLTSENTNVSIRVENQYGSDTDTRKIIYNALCDGYNNGNRNAPNVNITRPSANPYTTSESTASLKASITNVASKNDIIYTLNGQRTNNFSYNSTTDKFTATIPMNVERVDVVITATNQYGNDSDNTSIRATTSQSVNNVSKPIVKISKPISNPHDTRSNNERVVARITNVNNRSGINVKINNQPILNFDFNNNEISFITNLKSGNNTVSIKATNAAGSASDDVVIRYNAIQKPMVKINTPSFDPFTTSKDETNILATITNIDSKNNITFKVNGRKTNSFNFNTYTGKVTANIDLESGNNTVLIKATNSAGSDSDDVIIKYNRKGKPATPQVPLTVVKTPIVNITKPATPSYTSDSDKANIIATVKHVPSRDDIIFKVNGKRITSFQYLPQINRFMADITLKNGNNTILITGRNGSKTASDDATIKYERGSSTGQFGDTYSSDDDDDDEEEEEDDNGGANTGNTSKPSSRGLGKRNTNTKTDNKTSTTDKRTKKTSSSKASPVTQKTIIEVIQPKGLRSKTTRAATLDIEVKVTNVAKKDIQLFVNGKLTDKFTYSAKSNILEATVNLKKGSNAIKIKAGKQTKTISLLRL